MTWEDFLPFIAPSVASCPIDTITFHTRMAAIEFCRKAHVWRESLDGVLADGHSVEYTLPIDDQIEVAKLLSVTLTDSAGVKPREATVMESIEGRLEMRRGCTELIAWTDNRRALSVWPAPRAEAEISVYAAIKPSTGAFSFNDEVFAHHAEDIATGALGRLYAMPRCDWTDAALAEISTRMFKDRINSAARAAGRGNARHNRPRSGRHF